MTPHTRRVNSSELISMVLCRYYPEGNVAELLKHATIQMIASGVIVTVDKPLTFWAYTKQENDVRYRAEPNDGYYIVQDHGTHSWIAKFQLRENAEKYCEFMNEEEDND